ncbi:MAG: methionyl-tRNA formyltransferase [Bacteroidales bacterium]|nr:methionyl-tRNA formyltransferase [Bacteroidales bacterium]
MKKLDQFILKSFIGPFFGILVVVEFILMMQFLWLYIDELVGKGLGLRIILEFMGWGAATLLPLSLPLSTLLGSVMTYGQMSENNELIAVKASGISLKRMLLPIMIASAIISIGAFFAANNLVPVAFNKIYTLRDDIGKTKEEISIPTGTFYDGLDGYVLRVEEKDGETGMMHGVMVYDHTSGKGNVSVTLADSAMMKMSKAKDYITFQLFSGINYQETNTMRYRDTTLQMQKIEFSRQEMIIPLENYAFKKSSGARYGDQVKSMDLSRQRAVKDSLSRQLDSVVNRVSQDFWNIRTIRYYNQLDTSSHFEHKTMFEYPETLNWRNTKAKRRAYESASSVLGDYSMLLQNSIDGVRYETKILNKASVEILHKFAQALACLIFFFIGAPLGAFATKRRGLGASLIIAVLFFVLYWVVDISGVKLGNDGKTSAAVAVFFSSAVLLPTGLFLSWKAVNDAKLFSGVENFASWWRKTKSKIMGFFKKTRIVYMGTPEFAVAPLDALVKAGYNVVGIVTVADKPSGRGLKLNESAVKKYAVEHNIPVLQPVKLKDPEFLSALEAFKADLFVVVAFRMLPEVVWKMPPLGTFNLHAALLPQYRGAAPINWAVINGERMTGATTFMIDENIDTGGIMLRQELRISETDTAGDVHDKLMPIGAELVVQSVEGIIERNIETRVQRSFIQGSEVLKPAPKLTRELCHIDWNDSTVAIYNLIRGLSPYPAAFTELVKDGEATQLKIYSAEKVGNPSGAAPGTVISDGKTFMQIATADGAISLKDIQLAGKKRMDIKAFLAGFREPQSYKTSEGTSKAEIAKTRSNV